MVEEGALADLILVDGNPLEHLDLVGDPGKNFKLIMKDEKITNNTGEWTSTFWCCRLWHLADLDAGAELVRSRQLRRCVDEADAKTCAALRRAAAMVQSRPASPSSATIRIIGLK